MSRLNSAPCESVNFGDKSNQTKEVFDSEKCPSRRDGYKSILWPDVRPLQRHRGFASLGVQEKDTTLARQLPYTVNLKLDISVWMERVNDPECLLKSCWDAVE
jgi:hypothetical protein